MVAQYGEFDCAFASSVPNSDYLVSVKRGAAPCTVAATARPIWINVDPPGPGSGYTGPVSETYTETCDSLSLRRNPAIPTYLYKGPATRIIPTTAQFAADAGRFWGQAGGIPRVTSQSGNDSLASVAYEYPPIPHWRSAGIATLSVRVFQTEAAANASFAKLCRGCPLSSHGYKYRRPSVDIAPTVFVIGKCRNLLLQMTLTALYSSNVTLAPSLAVADGIFTRAERLGMAGCF
jgi:hypothetical protein